MNILLFGGSFNPPHLGHQIVISQAFELINDLNEIWLLPTFNHSFGKELAPANNRLDMLQLLVNELHNHNQILPVKVCPIEIDNHASGQTYDTLQLLKSKYPDYTFSFLMGSDQLPSFDKWGNWQQLLAEMHFFVYPRSGHRHDVVFPNMTLLESPTQVITNISSTLVRQRLGQNLPTTNTLPSAIKDYITQNQLYNLPVKQI